MRKYADIVYGDSWWLSSSNPLVTSVSGPLVLRPKPRINPEKFKDEAPIMERAGGGLLPMASLEICVEFCIVSRWFVVVVSIAWVGGL